MTTAVHQLGTPRARSEVILNDRSLRLERVSDEDKAAYTALIKRGIFSKYLRIDLIESSIIKNEIQVTKISISDMHLQKIDYISGASPDDRTEVIPAYLPPKSVEKFELSVNLEYGQTLEYALLSLIREKYTDTFIGRLLRA